MKTVAMWKLGVTYTEVKKGKVRQWITRQVKPLLTFGFVEYRWLTFLIVHIQSVL